MKPKVVITREKSSWVAQATVMEDLKSFSCSGEDTDPQVAVYRALHGLYSDVAHHYKSQFQVKVEV